LGLEKEISILSIAEKVRKENLSVRQTEKLVRKIMEKDKKRKSPEKKLNREIMEIQNRLIEHFSTRVKVKPEKGNSGKIEFCYNSNEEFNRLVELFGLEEKWY